MRVNDYDELVEFSAMFAKAKAPRGPRIGVIPTSSAESDCPYVGDMTAWMTGLNDERSFKPPRTGNLMQKKMRPLVVKVENKLLVPAPFFRVPN